MSLGRGMLDPEQSEIRYAGHRSVCHFAVG